MTRVQHQTNAMSQSHGIDQVILKYMQLLKKNIRIHDVRVRMIIFLPMTNPSSVKEALTLDFLDKLSFRTLMCSTKLNV